MIHNNNSPPPNIIFRKWEKVKISEQMQFSLVAKDRIKIVYILCLIKSIPAYWRFRMKILQCLLWILLTEQLGVCAKGGGAIRWKDLLHDPVWDEWELSESMESGSLSRRTSQWIVLLIMKLLFVCKPFTPLTSPQCVICGLVVWKSFIRNKTAIHYELGKCSKTWSWVRIAANYGFMSRMLMICLWIT